MNRRQFIDMPERIARLPRDARGFPIPKFVHWMDGVPDFRIMDPAHMRACVRQNKCWICGEQMGTHKGFVSGPMCCINRISAEPPSHRECALFAAKNCPFLTTPAARRNERGLPEQRSVAGKMIERNPGVAAVWMTKSYEPMRVDNGVLFRMGEPQSIEFYAQGRIATRAEVNDSIMSGLPILLDAAEMDGPAAVSELAAMKRRFDKLLETMVVMT